ncbi:hypothetical protein [Sphingomonas sp.]|jgi:hypothetical protein|uniref:hypothetical protein n=1 Tax=Sphingomonadales TaxID=204457 RepID=UPI0035C7A1FB
MSLFGSKPPKVPEGGEAYVAQDDLHGDKWSVRVDMGDGAARAKQKRLSPTFADMMNAYAYLAWINGEVDHFTYPAGRA